MTLTDDELKVTGQAVGVLIEFYEGLEDMRMESGIPIPFEEGEEDDKRNELLLVVLGKLTQEAENRGLVEEETNGC